jgi:hypothetical protein
VHPALPAEQRAGAGRWKRSCRTPSSCVHRHAAGRDYAAPLQLKLLSLTSERLGCSEVEYVSIMMRSIAIGLAAATIAIGGSTLNASAHYGQESGISKGSMSRLTPREREHLRAAVRERLAGLTPREREHLGASVRPDWTHLRGTPGNPRT